MEWDKHEFSKVIVARALTAFFIQTAVAFILSFILALFRPESAEVLFQIMQLFQSRTSVLAIRGVTAPR